jgi:putative sigma-54 modulation protein
VNIAITFRHMEATEAMKVYATEKVAKLQKFLRQPMKGQVTLSCEKKLHRAEVDIHSGAEHYHAHEESEDMYASVDLVIDKLERQIRAARKTSTSRRKGGDRASDHLLPAVEDSGEE